MNEELFTVQENCCFMELIGLLPGCLVVLLVSWLCWLVGWSVG
jgi:hypothetical protein